MISVFNIGMVCEVYYKGWGIIMLIRENGGHPIGLSNDTVRTYFRQSGVEDVYEDLEKYDDFQASAIMSSRVQSKLKVSTRRSSAS
jgi:hypothetical protein